MANLNDIFNPGMSGIPNARSTISSFYSAPAKKAFSTVIAPKASIPQAYQLKDRGVSITDSDIEAFRPLLYGEVSNRNFNKKTLEGDVILNTALNRQKEYARKGQKKTVSEILAMPNQYQAYGSPQYQEYHNAVLPNSVAKRKEVDAIVDSIKERIKRGEFKDNTQGAYYYVHKKDNSIIYDNTKKLFSE